MTATNAAAAPHTAGDESAESSTGRISGFRLTAVGIVLATLALCLTVIGIPLGLASFRMVPISLLPLGREIVPVA